jgi:hypothetical protein
MPRSTTVVVSQAAPSAHRFHVPRLPTAGDYAVCYCSPEADATLEDLGDGSTTYQVMSRSTWSRLAVPAELAESQCVSQCADGCEGPDCHCSQAWTSASLGLLTDPDKALCMPPAQCMDVCDSVAACAGVRVNADFCELLGAVDHDAAADEDATAEVFKKTMGTACTHSQDFNEEVGTLAVTERARTGVRYVLAPDGVGSIEVLGAFGSAAADGTAPWDPDRIMVIDSCGTCGVTPASEYVTPADGRAWPELPPLKDIVWSGGSGGGGDGGSSGDNGDGSRGSEDPGGGRSAGSGQGSGFGSGTEGLLGGTAGVRARRLLELHPWLGRFAHGSDRQLSHDPHCGEGCMQLFMDFFECTMLGAQDEQGSMDPAECFHQQAALARCQAQNGCMHDQCGHCVEKELTAMHCALSTPGCMDDPQCGEIHDGVCGPEYLSFRRCQDEGGCLDEDARQCAVGCTADMLGNGICDDVCNSEDCGFDGDDCLEEAHWTELPAREALCKVDPGGCEEKLNACLIGCGYPPPCSDRLDLIASVGLDEEHFFTNGGCAGLMAAEDEDGHRCEETFAELEIFDGASPGATLCDVCCGTCKATGHSCPEPPFPASAGECVERCAQRHLPAPPQHGRRRRASESSVLRFFPVHVTSGGRYKVCFCDSALRDGCTAPTDFDIEVGTLHGSGVHCLLEAGLRDQTCSPQDEGGLACTGS